MIWPGASLKWHRERKMHCMMLAAYIPCSLAQLRIGVNAQLCDETQFARHLLDSTQRHGPPGLQLSAQRLS